MTEKRELIDTLMDRTGLDPYKLKRLSADELKQLHAAYKKDEEIIVELLEKLEPENYLTGHELADRMMYAEIVGSMSWLWRKITGQPEIPINFVGIMFMGLCYIGYGALLFGFIAFVIIPGAEWLFGFDMSKNE